MKLGPKLIISFVIVSVLSLVVGVTGYTQITGVNHELKDITTNKVPALDYSMEMGIAIWAQRDAAAAYMLGDTDAKSDFEAFKEDFDSFSADLRLVYTDSSAIDDIDTDHETFDRLAEAANIGLFDLVDEEAQGIVDQKTAMEEFDAAAEEMLNDLDDLEDMQTIRKETAQTNYENAIEGADAAMEMKIALRQQQVAAKSYLLGENTYNDYVQNEQLFDTEYDALVNVMNVSGTQQAGQMHSNFNTFFYGGSVPNTVTLTMEDGSQETFTVGQIIVGVKPSYDNMILSEAAAMAAMSTFDVAAAQLQTGNSAGIAEDEVGGDDDAGLDGLEEYATTMGEFGETAMDAMIEVNRLRDTAGEYLLENNASSLTGIEQNFENIAVEFDGLLQTMDILAEIIDGATVNSPTNKLLQEVRNVRDLYGQLLDWATDSSISGITYTTVGTSNLGMFQQHDAELQKILEYGQEMEDTDAAGTVLFVQIDTNATLSTNATLRDLIWEQLMAVNDYVISGDPVEKAAFTSIGNQIAALPYYSEFQTEHQAVNTEGTTCIAAYDAYISARNNRITAMDQFDTLGLRIEYGDTDYLVIYTTYGEEGSTDPNSATNPSTVGDDQGLDYLEWRGDVYAIIDETSMNLALDLKTQQDIAGEYLLEQSLTNLSAIETEFMQVAEDFDELTAHLETFSNWMNDDILLLTHTLEVESEHDHFLDMATDVDWSWTTPDETDSALDGMFTAHYDDLMGDQAMLDQLEDFDAMANEIATVLENLEVSVQTDMSQAKAELDIAFMAADHSMELKILLVQQKDIAAEYLLEDNVTSLPAIKTEFSDFVDEFDLLVNDFITLVDDGIAGQNSEEALVAEVAADHEAFLDYATDDSTMDNNQLHDGMLETHDDELAAIAAAKQAMEDLDAAGELLVQDLSDVETTAADDMAQAQVNADNVVSTAILMIFSIAIIAMIIGILFGLILSRGITRPVAQLASGSEKLAKGDFSVEMDIKTGNDEIGDMVRSYQEMLANTAGPLRELNLVAQAIANGDLSKDINIEAKGEIDEMVKAFQKMQENLRNLVNEIQSTAGNVASTSQELASSAEEMNASTQQVSSAINQISKGSQEQASKVEESVKVMKEMAASVDEVAQRSQSGVESATITNDSVKEGKKAVEDTVTKMKEIQRVVSDSAEVIGNLGERSKEIGDIVNVITNITDQTNLLALNAAIEAARAGEQGRGFAVVADEVKALAEDSREAAERISKMIKEIQDETEKAVLSMEQGTKEVDEGMAAVGKTDEIFTEISEASQKVTEGIGAISAATQQQKAGTEEVARSIDSIASIAEETASASEESASSTEELTASMEEMTARAQELSEMAMALQKSAGRFKLREDEDRTAEGQAKPPAARPQKKKARPPVPKPKPRPQPKADAPIPQNMEESLKQRGIQTPGGD